MKNLIELGEISKEQWNPIAGHPLQSFEWGEARAKMGTRVVRLAHQSGNILTRGYQMTLHPVLGTYKIGYVPKSFIPDEGDLEDLYEYGRQNSLIFIKFEPHVQVGRVPSRLVKSHHPLFPEDDLLLDLTSPFDVLFSNLKSKTRYNVRLAQKKGVTVQEMTNEEGFNIFLKLYFDTCRRQHYFGHNESYHRTIYETLKGSMLHILVAYYEGIPLGVYELFLYNNILYYPYGGSSIEHRNLMATNLLMWEAILFGQKKGATQFDMWGSAPPGYDDTHPFAGFTRLKEGYGSQFIKYVGSYDLVINPLMYTIFNKANTLRKVMLRFKR